VTVAYAICGVAFVVALDQIVGIHMEVVSADLVAFLVALSGLIVYPCAFVAAVVVLGWISRRGRSSSLGRAWIAGAFTFGLLLLELQLRVPDYLEAWMPLGELRNSLLGGVLCALTPFSFAASGGLALSELLPCGRGSRVPEGCSRKTILPPGVTK
jgi:hypothetical protein